MENEVLIRVDASDKMGSGHLMRCLAMADYLSSRNFNICFLSRSECLRNRLENKAFYVSILEPDMTVEDELNRIKHLTSEAKVMVMILDINNYSTFTDVNTYCCYLQGIKELSLFLVSFEDEKVHPSISDIVIIPYAGAEKMGLGKEGNCRYLLGSKYFVLREDFSMTESVMVRKSVGNILITMGGSDPEGITLTVLKALNDAELDINLKVVIGGFSQMGDNAIRDALGKYRGEYSIVRDVNNMAQLMFEADVAIINSGLTKYEAAAAGLPCIVISNNEYHSQLMNSFAEYGTALHLGVVNDLEKHDICEAVTYLISDQQKRQQMSDAGRRLIDGGGVARIFSEISRDLISA